MQGARGGAEEATARPAVGTAAGKPYKCTECPKSFKTSWLRKRHVMYRHTKEKPHQCPKCDYECVERSKIKRHINSMQKRKVKSPLLRTPKTTCCRFASKIFRPQVSLRDTYKIATRRRNSILAPFASTSA